MPALLNREVDITFNDLVTQTTAQIARSNILYRMKELLIDTGGNAAAGAFTVVASCGYNGSTWDVGTADYWTSGAAIVGAASGVDHSWCLLEGPEGQQVLFDVNDTAADWWRTAFARPDDQYSLTGLVSTDPPADPASVVFGSGLQMLENVPTLTTTRINFIRDDAGSFWFGFAFAGWGFMCSSIAFFRLSTSGTGYSASFPDYPFWCQVNSYAGANIMLRSYFANGQGWSSGGIPMAIYIDTRNNMSTMGSGGTVAGDYPRFPMEFYTDGTPEIAHRGVMPDFGVFPGAPAQNDLEPGSDTIRYIVVGSFDLLTNGSTQITY